MRHRPCAPHPSPLPSPSLRRRSSSPGRLQTLVSRCFPKGGIARLAPRWLQIRSGSSAMPYVGYSDLLQKDNALGLMRAIIEELFARDLVVLAYCVDRHFL